MSIIYRTSGTATNANRATGNRSLLRMLVIWHAAWQEHRALKHLDKRALEDMGITAADLEEITVHQIASRMLG